MSRDIAGNIHAPLLPATCGLSLPDACKQGLDPGGESVRFDAFGAKYGARARTVLPAFGAASLIKSLGTGCLLVPIMGSATGQTPSLRDRSFSADTASAGPVSAACVSGGQRAWIAACAHKVRQIASKTGAPANA